MPEPLTPDLVAELLKELHVAFPRNLGAQNPGMMASVYRNGLSGLSGDGVRFAVRRSIEQEQYFPRVARLRALAEEWQRRNAPGLNGHHAPNDPDTCAICGARAAPRFVTRYVRDPAQKYALVLDANGERKTETVVVSHTAMSHDPRAHGITHDNGRH